MTDKWLARAVDNMSSVLATIREQLFATRFLQRHERVLDLTADTGELTLEAVRQVPEGGVWSLASSKNAANALDDMAQNICELRRPVIMSGNPEEIVSLMSAAGWGDVRFDMMVGRNLLSRAPDRVARIKALLPLLEQGGTIAVAENLPAKSQRLSLLLPPPGNEEEKNLRDRWIETEEKVYSDKSDKRFAWGIEELAAAFTQNGLHEPETSIVPITRLLTITRGHLDRWFAPVQGSYATALYTHGLSEDEITAMQNLAYASLAERNVEWHSCVAIIKSGK